MCFIVVFFFQAEDGIRDIGVTGVQTCALPISSNFSPETLSIINPYLIEYVLISSNFLSFFPTKISLTILRAFSPETLIIDTPLSPKFVAIAAIVSNSFIVSILSIFMNIYYYKAKESPYLGFLS